MKPPIPGRTDTSLPLSKLRQRDEGDRMNPRRLPVGAALAVASSACLALQVIEPVEGQNAFVKISRQEITRLVIDGGQIRSIISSDGELAIQKDDDLGQLFIVPIVLDKPINVRVVSNSGGTYSLVMQVVDMPQEDIVIKESAAARGKLEAGEHKGKAGSVAKAVRSLLAAMALEESSNRVDAQAMNQEFALWENTRFILTAIYTGQDLLGEKYVLTNTGSAPLRLVEQELYRKGVVAVAIENMRLEAGQSTNIYVVRNN
jgi:conjugal transfer pilus assembly protein TraK